MLALDSNIGLSWAFSNNYKSSRSEFIPVIQAE
jgi:hypothetical protein